MTSQLGSIQALRDAVNNEGRNPQVHREALADLQKNWPVLWKAIEGVIE